MDGFLSFLLFGLFFFVMMRFGCGAHVGHGGHAHHHGDEHDERHPRQGSRAVTGGPFRDPVCGMPVAAAEGYARPFQGAEYHFCSRKCLDTFDAEPERYARSDTHSAATGGNHHE